jgi:hypothetical protein
VERVVSTGECAETDPLMSAGGPDRAVTERILDIADEAGHRAVLADATDGTVTAWPRFARSVRAAARGLGRRGLTEADTAGVFVEDAASAAIAVNAIRAAGATACLISRDSHPADVATRLNACGARLLITSAPIADLAAEGADRSRVRQIISFGEAAGTTPFDSLLQAAGHDAAGESGHLEGNGQADRYDVSRDVRYDARYDMASGRGAGLTCRDVVVAAPPCGDGQAYLSLLDRTLLAGALLVATPLPLVTAALRVYRGTAAIVPSGTVVPGFPQARVFPVA